MKAPSDKFWFYIHQSLSIVGWIVQIIVLGVIFIICGGFILAPIYWAWEKLTKRAEKYEWEQKKERLRVHNH